MHYITNNPKATIIVFEMFNWFTKEGWHIYQEHGQKKMQQKKRVVATLLTKFLKKIIQIIFQEP